MSSPKALTSAKTWTHCRGAEEATEGIRGLEQLCWEPRLRGLGLLRLWESLKGGLRKMGTHILAGPVMTGQGAIVLNLKRVDLDRI